MTRPLRVGIVGAGPAGIYAADLLTKDETLSACGTSVSIDILDKLPSPYGLVRYGVAPDHPRIKQIQGALHKILDKPEITFYGNVEYGVDLKLEDLRRHYDAVVFATGSDRDRPLDIPGVDLPGSHGAADFVFWYDSHPDVSPSWHVDGTSVGGCSFIIMVEHAVAALHHGLCDVAVVSHGESGRSGVGVTRTRDTSLTGQFEIPYGFGAAPTSFALVTTRHMHEYGTTLEQWAQVAVSTRAWARLNPKAMYRDPLTIKEVLKARLIAWPFTVLNICLVTDAGGAVVLTRADRARDCAKKPVYVRGTGEATVHVSITQMRSLAFSEATRLSGARAFAMAGVGPGDFDHVMLYDAFTSGPPLMLEALGLAKRGEGVSFFAGGRAAPGGMLPINTSGGGLSYTHTGMYGIFPIIEATRQLRGDLLRALGTLGNDPAAQARAAELYAAHLVEAGARVIQVDEPAVRERDRARGESDERAAALVVAAAVEGHQHGALETEPVLLLPQPENLEAGLVQAKPIRMEPKQASSEIAKIGDKVFEGSCVSVEFPRATDANDRVLGTELSGAIARARIYEGAPEGSQNDQLAELTFNGGSVAGQGFGAFNEWGVLCRVEGGAQDGVAKTMLGGKEEADRCRHQDHCGSLQHGNFPVMIRKAANGHSQENTGDRRHGNQGADGYQGKTEMQRVERERRQHHRRQTEAAGDDPARRRQPRAPARAQVDEGEEHHDEQEKHHRAPEHGPPQRQDRARLRPGRVEGRQRPGAAGGGEDGKGLDRAAPAPT